MKNPLRIVIVAALALGTLLAFTAGGSSAEAEEGVSRASRS